MSSMIKMDAFQEVLLRWKMASSSLSIQVLKRKKMKRAISEKFRLSALLLVMEQTTKSMKTTLLLTAPPCLRVQESMISEILRFGEKMVSTTL